MKKCSIKVYPDVGDIYYVSDIPVSDTDNTDVISDDVCKWIEWNLQHVASFDVISAT